MNQSLLFAFLSGGAAEADLPHLEPIRTAVGRMYQLHLPHPNKFALEFSLANWASLNFRRVVSLRGNANRLCLLRKAGRPTFEDLKEAGLSLDPLGGDIYTLPPTFGLDSPLNTYVLKS